MIDRNFVLVQKDRNVKKESYYFTDLKDCLPNLPLKTGKAQKKIKFFTRQFYASLNTGLRGRNNSKPSSGPSGHTATRVYRDCHELGVMERQRSKEFMMKR
jgi:hypothetical protein